ncbi:MAG: hypothetical protein QXI59_07575 [Candidatus Bathyarchaeia archaeon]
MSPLARITFLILWRIKFIWQNKNGKLPYKHHMTQLQSYFSIMKGTYRFPVDKLILAYMDDVTPPLIFEVERRDLTVWLIDKTTRLDGAL